MSDRIGASESYALCLTDLWKEFNQTPVVQGLDLQLGHGEFLSLLGPSGCGKTTTLRLIAGFEQPDRGSVEVGGRLVARAGSSEPPERRQVGMVFQEAALFPHLRVEQNVAYGLVGKAGRKERIREALDLVGLQGLEHRFPHELSGGQQQRVALARALAPNPDIILLDEPFASIDATLRAELRAEVRQILQAAGATTLLVTHDQDEALSLSDRVAVMWGGRIVQVGTPEELYYRPVDRIVAGFVGDAQFLPGVAEGRRVICELGDLPIFSPASGAVDVMLRPEMLRLTAPLDGQEPNATVVSRLFFGHDQLMQVQMDKGSKLNVRLGTYLGFRLGDRIHLSVRGAVLTFPRSP